MLRETTTTDGEGLAATERFGNGDAAAAYRQRTGAPARDGLVDLGIARIDGANADLLYEAHPGALGDELTERGLRPLGGGERRRHAARRRLVGAAGLLPLGRRRAHGQLRPGAARDRRPAAAPRRRLGAVRRALRQPRLSNVPSSTGGRTGR